jgi:ferritin-like metal-binding protein YciE
MRPIDEQLTKYLTDAHSIEEQALQQLEYAPRLAGTPDLAAAFREHLAETALQRTLLETRLDARGAKPSKLKDVAGRAGGFGFLLFARFQPDTPGKLAAHAYAYEHFELAAYELVSRVAERAEDDDTAEIAREIRGQERRMAERIETLFDQAVTASLRDVAPDDMERQLVKYLTDAHAIEAQAIQLLEKGPAIAGTAELADLYAQHLHETRDQQRQIEERLAAHGAGRNVIKNAAARVGALSWGAFFMGQPDTPGKLAAFAYAFEHLEIAGYEQLQRVAHRAGDDETIATAERIIEEERNAAEKIAQHWDVAVDASLDAVAVAR